MILVKFFKNTPKQFFFGKVAGLQHVTLLKNESYHRYFSRVLPIFEKQSKWLVLEFEFATFFSPPSKLKLKALNSEFRQFHTVQPFMKGLQHTKR